MKTQPKTNASKIGSVGGWIYKTIQRKYARKINHPPKARNSFQDSR